MSKSSDSDESNLWSEFYFHDPSTDKSNNSKVTTRKRRNPDEDTNDDSIATKNLKRKRKTATTITNEEIEAVVNTLEEINEELEIKAEKNKLSVSNVKSLLRAVIQDEGVQELVRQTLNPGEITSSCTTYEPKLTRSKFRQLPESQLQQISPLLLLSKNNPPIPTSECFSLIANEFPDDEEDEDYKPENEEEEDEIEDAEVKSNNDENFISVADVAPIGCELEASFEELDKNLLVIDEEGVRYATRSKSTLKDIPLEQIEHQFAFPDITEDMYDSECDNTEWTNFLKDYNYFQPEVNNVATENCDDPDDDPEYNVLADEEQDTIDREEFRTDKAVKVPRKEIDQLIADNYLSLESEKCASINDETINSILRLPIGDLSGNANKFRTDQSGIITNKEDVSSSPAKTVLPNLSRSQKLLFEQQIRQHIQFSLQHFMQCYKHPLLFTYAENFKSFINDFRFLLDSNSKFKSLNLESAIRLITEWELILNDTEILDFYKDRKNRNNFFPPMMDVMVKSEAFLYPLLLPAVPFLYTKTSKLDDKLDLSLPEENLISMGLDEFGKLFSKTPSRKDKYFREVAHLIKTHLIPVKSSYWLENYIKRKRTSKKDNPIKYFFEHRKSPLIKNYVVPLNIRPLYAQPLQLIPDIWQLYIRNVYFNRSKQ